MNYQSFCERWKGLISSFIICAIICTTYDMIPPEFDEISNSNGTVKAAETYQNIEGAYYTDSHKIMAFADLGEANFDIKGYVNDSWKQVTFADGGFISGVYQGNGLSISCEPEFVADGQAIRLKYTVKNNTEYSVNDYTFFIASDTMLDGDDASRNTVEDNIITMTNTNTGVTLFALSTTEGGTAVATEYGEECSVAWGDSDPRSVSNTSDACDSAFVTYFPVSSLAPGEQADYDLVIGMCDISLIKDIISAVTKALFNTTANYEKEELIELTPEAEYVFTYQDESTGTIYTYRIKSSDTGTISMNGIDLDGKHYDFIGKKLSVIEKGDGVNTEDSAPVEIDIAGRPVAQIPGSFQNKPEDIYVDDVTTTSDSIIINAKENQIYSLNKNDSSSWISPDSNGKVTFSGLSPYTDYTVYTRIKATGKAPASEISAGTTIITYNMFENIRNSTTTFIYDNKPHTVTVSTDVEDVEILYSDSLNGTYSTRPPEFSTVGDHDIFYSLKKDRYYSCYGKITMNIEKDVYNGEKNVSAILTKNAGSRKVVKLPDLPEGAVYSTVSNSNSSISVGTVNSSNEVVIQSNGIENDTTLYFNICVTGADYYKDYNITVAVSPVDHVHTWSSYYSEDNKIKAVCGSDGCDPDNENKPFLTLNVQSGPYTGQPAAASIDGLDSWNVIGCSAPAEISYYRSKGYDSTEASGNALECAPSERGFYVAEISVQNPDGSTVSARKAFYIAEPYVKEDLKYSFSDCIYDKKEHSVKVTSDNAETAGIKVKYSTTNNYSDASEAVPVNAGEYFVFADVDAAGYRLDTKGILLGSFKISPKKIIVSASVSDKIYDGSVRADINVTDDARVITSDRIIIKVSDDQLEADDTCSFGFASALYDTPDVGSDKTVTVSGIYSENPDYEVDSCSTTITALADIIQRSINSSTINMSVDPVEYIWCDKTIRPVITITDRSKGLAEGTDEIVTLVRYINGSSDSDYTLTGTTANDEISTNVVIVLGRKNYTGKNKELLEWYIGKIKRTVEITNKESLNKVYNGIKENVLYSYTEPDTSLSVTELDMYPEVTVTYFDSEGHKLDSAPSRQGKYKVKVSVAESDHCSRAETEYEYEILKSKIQKPEPDLTEYTYDGTEKSYQIAESEYYTINNASSTNAGTYEVKVSLKDPENYEWDCGEGTSSSDDLSYTFEINKRLLTIEWSGYSEREYDGKESQITASAVNAADGDNISIVVENGNQKNAGTYEAFVSKILIGEKETGNYYFPSESSCSYTITPKKAEIQWTKKSVVYNGDERRPEAEAVNLAEGDKAEIIVDGSSAVNAGTYTDFKAVGISNSNYYLESEVLCDSFVITRKPVSDVTVDISGIFKYDEGVQYIPDVSAYFVNENGKTVNLVMDEDFELIGEITAEIIGNYTMRIKGIGNNYTGSVPKEWSIIGDSMIRTAPHPADNLVFDGEYHELLSYAGDVENGQFMYKVNDGEWSYEVPKQMTVGEYNVYCKVKGDNNYTDQPEQYLGKIIIKHKSVEKPQIDDSKYIFNEKEQTYNIAESDDYTVTGNKRTDAGSQKVIVSIKDNRIWDDGTTDDLEYIFEIGKSDQNISCAQISEISASSVTIKEADAGKGETLYAVSIDNTAPVDLDSWQSSNVFHGLSSETKYFVFVKYTGDDNYFEAVSEGVSFTTNALARKDVTGLIPNTSGTSEITEYDFVTLTFDGTPVKVEDIFSGIPTISDGTGTASSPEYQWKDKNTGKVLESDETPTEPGEYILTVTLKDEENIGIYEISFLIDKAIPETVDKNILNISSDTVFGKSDGKISGVSPEYEYSTDGGNVYIQCEGTEITGLSAGTVMIRKRETNYYKSSDPILVVIGEGSKLSFETFENDQFTITSDHDEVGYGDTIVLTLIPKEDYKVAEPLKITVGEKKYEFIKNSDGSYICQIDNPESLIISDISGVVTDYDSILEKYKMQKYEEADDINTVGYSDNIRNMIEKAKVIISEIEYDDLMLFEDITSMIDNIIENLKTDITAAKQEEKLISSKQYAFDIIDLAVGETPSETMMKIASEGKITIKNAQTEDEVESIRNNIIEKINIQRIIENTPEIVIGKEATCTNSGTKTYYRRFDGNFEDEACTVKIEDLDSWLIIPASGHKFGDWEEKRAATCTEEGLRERICEVCGEKESEITGAHGHHPEKGEGKAATCTESGTKTYYRCTDGYFEDEACTVKIEDLASWLIIPASGHKFGDWEEKKAATCTEEGLRERICEVCGEKESEITEACGHHPEKVEGKAATCTESGTKTYYRCTDGNFEDEECTVKIEDLASWIVIPASGHTPKTDKAKEATCTSAGCTAGSHCEVCGEVLKESKEIKALGHVIVKDPAKPASEDSTGLTEGTHCSRCGAVITAQRTVPKLKKNENSNKTDSPFEGAETVEEMKEIMLSETANMKHDCDGEEVEMIIEKFSRRTETSTVSTIEEMEDLYNDMYSEIKLQKLIQAESQKIQEDYSNLEKNLNYTTESREKLKENYSEIVEEIKNCKSEEEIQELDKHWEEDKALLCLYHLEVSSESGDSISCSNGISAGASISMKSCKLDEKENEIVLKYTDENNMQVFKILDIDLQNCEVNGDNEYEITVELPEGAPVGGIYNVVHISDDGSSEIIKATYNPDGTISFTTTHFSKFVVVGKKGISIWIGISGLGLVVLSSLLMLMFAEKKKRKAMASDKK